MLQTDATSINYIENQVTEPLTLCSSEKAVPSLMAQDGCKPCGGKDEGKQ